MKPKADVLFLIRARLDSGRAKGVPQLNKDIRVLKRAEEEIVRLREGVDACYRMLLSEPLTNHALDRAETMLRELMTPNPTAKRRSASA